MVIVMVRANTIDGKFQIKYATCHAVQLFNVIICYKNTWYKFKCCTYIHVTINLQKAQWARENVTLMTASQQWSIMMCCFTI